MTMQRTFTMRLISGMVAALTIVDHVQNIRPVFLFVNDAGNQLTGLSCSQGWRFF
jgi:hypothetical protein